MPLSGLFSTRPINRVSLAESVYQSILEAILSGTLPAGTELSEVALASELGVSRTPVHEALRRLAADSMVNIDTNRQARVARFSRQDVIDIYEMRGVLEPAAAERAALRIDPAVLAELRQDADKLSNAPDTGVWRARATDFDIRLHNAVAEASGNPRLRAEITKCRHLVRAFCRLSGSSEDRRNTLQEHLRILEALEEGNPTAARRAMAEHVAAQLQAVLRAIGSVDESQPT